VQAQRRPGHPYRRMAHERVDDAAEAERKSCAERARADEHGFDAQRFPRAAGELHVVDHAAWPVVAIDELVVEHVAHEVDDALAHPRPPWVTMSSGSAAIAASVVSTRKNQPSALPRVPFACAPMRRRSPAMTSTGK